MLPQVTFRGLLPTQTIVDTVWRGARKLSEAAPQLQECHVVIELVSHPSRERAAYHVAIHMSGNACEHEFRTLHATTDNVFGALAHAFDATHRNLRAHQGLLFAQEAAGASGMH